MTEATFNLVQFLFRLLGVALAYLVFIGLILLVMAHWGVPYLAEVKPQLPLIVVFYWILYRPTLMPPMVILLAGLVLDALSPGLPIGTHAVSYLLITGILKPRRRGLVGQPFAVVWVGFAVAALIDLVLKTVAMMAFTYTLPGVAALGFSTAITLLSFPLVVMLLALVHRVLPPSRGMISR